MFRQLFRSATYVIKSRSISFFAHVFLAAAEIMAEDIARHYRLPRVVKPVNYRLDFVPNFSSLTFTARASVELQVIEPTNRIIFNSRGLEILSATYHDTRATITYDEEQEIVVFGFPTELQSGKGYLNLDFHGEFANDMLGLYHSTYTDVMGKKYNIIATQFESVFARRAFPCMDEPDRKATFEISIVALDDQVALSNMPEISRDVVPTPEGCSEPLDGHSYVKITFDRTPIMSTYIVAMVLGYFEYISATAPGNHISNVSSSSASETEESTEALPPEVEIRVYTPLGKRDFGQHALTVVKKSLPFYAKLFGYPYPLPKLDLVAIPDFACNAMENWGLVTYRETALLIDPENSSLASKQNVALTVAHEVSHMWFGNLVTMSWWTDLWLNEGFATWAEYLAVDHCFPDYDIWTLFVSREYIRALQLDELKSSHPIQVEVNSAREVEEIFDAVSYQKGSCVIRMLYNYVGASSFEAGLKSYFKRFKYSNAETQDLWTALEATGVDNLTELMSPWTKQTGYPVLSVRRICAPDGTYSIGLKQQRFLADSSSTEEESLVCWRIPIDVCAVDDSKSILFRLVTDIPSPSPYSTKTPEHGDKEQFTPETGVKSQEIIHFLPDSDLSPRVRLNPNAIGFYRVHYDSAMMDTILEAISRGTVPERDRVSLLDDQFALARAGFQGLDKVLQFCRAFVGETRYSVWSVLSERLAQVQTLLEEASYPAEDEVVFPEASREICGLNNLYMELALPVYEKIGFKPIPYESNNDRLLRSIIISILGRIGHSDVITNARTAFTRHHAAVISASVGEAAVDQSNLISPDLRTAVYSICMRSGGDKEFWKLFELYNQATLNDERVRILSSLGATTNADIIQRVFKLTFTEDVRKQDRFHVLLSVTGSAGGRRALWNLVRARIATLSEDLGTSHLLARVLVGSASSFALQERYDEIKAFYEEHDVPCPRVIQQTLEAVKINVAQWKRDEKAVSTFLNNLADKDKPISPSHHVSPKRRRLAPSNALKEKNLP
ncbi:puromycin sensitive aminopeptidase [Echinococcus multilocularis]|uniref:Puromycin sensitive aminopeptidase n=1 Tax=Echinococcus multilocularis TaxID=6211 RepID=A0A068XVT8_ECHMU|nr:puromycin sensitive aminopeptidase [Echinococcus multilocularis]